MTIQDDTELWPVYLRPSHGEAPCGTPGCENIGILGTIAACDQHVAGMVKAAAQVQAMHDPKVPRCLISNSLSQWHYDDHYVGTLTQTEIDMGKADELVKRRAERDVLDSLDFDH